MIIHLVAGARPNFMKIAPPLWDGRTAGRIIEIMLQKGQGLY